MLLHLRIRDFVIMDQIELEFPPGFTVITGETGAGKSIVIDALSAVLGGRVSQEVVRSGALCAEVEALFDISSQPKVKERLEARDLQGDDADMLLIRRVIGPKGRAKVLVNGHLSTVAMLSEIVRGLVEISGQHEQQSLLAVENHRDILDTFGQYLSVRQNYEHNYQQFLALVKQREVLQKEEAHLIQHLDFLRFQWQEIKHVAPQLHEDKELELVKQRLSHVEKLQLGVSNTEQLLYSEDGSVFDKLGKAAAELQSLALLDEELNPLAIQLDSLRHDAEEIARILRRYANRIEADPEKLEEVDARLNALKRLCRKYGATLEEVLAKQESLAEEIKKHEQFTSSKTDLENAEAALKSQVEILAEQLSLLRREQGAIFDQVILAEIAEMDLHQAIFRTSVIPQIELSASGKDDVEFLWSANPGETLKGLTKIASGGELSRLMLAIKSVLCQHDLVAVYVFDEVDTGLGGQAAECIGRKIQSVAKGHQAITITHLASIAAHADHHLRVTKHTVDDRTLSQMTWISKEQRTEEIARMIDGNNISSATLEAAKDMLKRRAS